MSIFTSKKTEWRRSIQTNGVSATAFNDLSNAMGRERAKDFLELIYDAMAASKLDIKTFPADLLRDFMIRERNNVTTKQQYVASLMPRTKSGELGRILNANLMPEGDYYKTRAGTGLSARDLAIDKAANWICGGYVAGIPATRALLGEYIPTRFGDHGKTGPGIGRNADHLRKMYKRIVPGAPAYRFNYMAGDVKYPSTVGGNFLLDLFCLHTGGAADWPPPGNNHWESIAMFYLSFIVTVQAFADGNKRTGHLAYAIVLIKGTHNFKAPTAAKEAELFKMNG